MKFSFLFFLIFVFIVQVSAQSNWEWINPKPQGNDLNNVFFFNSSIGWAVGTNGTILKTTNGGENWSIKKTTTSLSLLSIFFIDENNGWAVGDSNIVLRSEDGGENWYTIYLEKNNLQYLKCYFLNNNFGYVIGKGAGDYFGLYKTINGGSKWHQSSEYNIKDFRVSLAGMWCSDVNNKLIKIFPIPIDSVLDISKVYLSPSNPFPPYLIYFMDENNAIYISNDSIFRTNNQWKNWTSSESTLPENPKEAYFTNVENGFIFCTNGKIFVTNNGGFTFSEKPYLFSDRVDAIYFKNANDWVAVGKDGLIIKTTNGGNSWREISNRIYINNRYDFGLSSLQFPTKDVGYAVGNNSTVLKTSNSGLNWTSLQMTDTCNLLSVFFVNKDTGWAVGAIPNSTAGRIYKTVNGGTSWEASFPGGIDSWNRVVYFVNSQVGFVGSAKGIIWKTTNAGISWSKKRQQSYEQIYSIQFPSVEKGWAVAYGQYPNYYTLVSTNGGETWNYKQTFSTGIINSIYFVNDSIGLLVGTEIYKTTDSGETWIKKASLGYSMGSVHFKDELNGYCVGGYGRIFKTSDGGETWQLEYFTNKYPASIFHNRDSWWIAGENLMLLKKSDPTVGNVEIQGIKENGFYLYDNYPNPFGEASHSGNSSTTIRFYIPHTSTGSVRNSAFITLKVYDVLGREVATLVNEEKAPGTYNSEFRIPHSALPNGVYFYQLRAGGYVETKKMILMK